MAKISNSIARLRNYYADPFEVKATCQATPCWIEKLSC